MEGPIRSSLPERNKRIVSVVADQRLEAWLAFLRDVRFQENFRIHTHSSIVLEPKLLLDLFSGDVPLTKLLVLARSIASSEWSGRFCSTDDETAVQTLLAAKESFFVFPTKAIALDKSPLLFSFVSCVSQIPHWCNYLRREGIREAFLTTANVGIYLTPSSSGGVLDVFSSCLGTLMQASNVSFPILPLVQKQAVSEILLRQGVFIRSAADSFPLPYKSLIDAITSFGVNVSPWCFDIPKEKPKSLIEAVRCSANVGILIVPLRSDEQHQTWPLRQNEKELCIIAERGDRFGGVLRLQVAEKQAHVTVLTPIPYFRKITLNSGPLQAHVDISNGLIIEFTVDLNVRVSVHVVRES